MSKAQRIKDWLRTVQAEDIKATAVIDQHHIGGLSAARSFFDMLSPAPQSHILDIGCGYGGPARLLAQSFDTHVHGIDIDSESCMIAQLINEHLEMPQMPQFHVADILSFQPQQAYDAAYMIHSSMPIKDKQALYNKIHSLLKPGGHLGLYEVYKTGTTDSVTYPVPWARSIGQSFLETAEEAKTRLQESGFTVTLNTDYSNQALPKTEDALFYVSQNEQAAKATTIVLGTTFWQKLENLHNALKNELCTPRMIIARKT